MADNKTKEKKDPLPTFKGLLSGDQGALTSALSNANTAYSAYSGHSGVIDLSGGPLTVSGGLVRTLPAYTVFEKNFSELKTRIAEQAEALETERKKGKQKTEELQALEGNLNELKAKAKLNFLLSRVCPAAQDRLLSDEAFQALFLSDQPSFAFVMSVDIRRSTELMLKARTPELFAAFITDLCKELSTIVTESFGVFDKFTGDGVLAFFPAFYSGDEAGLSVVSAADKCHRAFERHYHRNRSSFTSVLTDVGLGIGIDFGSVQLVQVADGLTVVGAPVVYACRLSGAPPKTTLINQPAFEKISERFGQYCFIEETELDIKHEGAMLAYRVRLHGATRDAARPDWSDPSSASRSGETAV